MKNIKKVHGLCTCCMEEHEVSVVELKEHTMFKGIEVDFAAEYFYCENADELYADETMLKNNDRRMKDAYRKKMGLLTGQEIGDIRAKYEITQGDLCVLLGWGRKTITRYEGHQVQDKAHDSILKKIDEDSGWFLHLLIESEHDLPIERYKKYYEKAVELYEKSQEEYLKKSIEAQYIHAKSEEDYDENVSMSLDIVKMVISKISQMSKDEIANYRNAIYKLGV